MGGEGTATEEHTQRKARTPLADLTGGRAWLGALVLLGAYLVPVLSAWGLAWLAATGSLGAGSTLGPLLALGIPMVLIVVLTIGFGGWFRYGSFGEEYPISFSPGRGILLALWRFVMQVGSVVLVALGVVQAEEAATLQRITNAEIRELESLAQGSPVPGDWELFSDSVRQSEYADVPNATYSADYTLPGPITVADLEEWLRDPGWASGRSTSKPIGALRNIECDAERVSCRAEVTPQPGEPVERTVEVRLVDYMTVVLDDGSEGAMVTYELAYEQDH